VNVQVHVLLAGIRIATIRASSPDPAANVLYYHRDAQGSVVATTISGGLLGARYRYGPYGELVHAQVVRPAGESDLGYTGAVKLSGGLLHPGARFVSPRLCEMETRGG
jgi:hypothetical protein